MELQSLGPACGGVFEFLGYKVQVDPAPQFLSTGMSGNTCELSDIKKLNATQKQIAQNAFHGLPSLFLDCLSGVDLSTVDIVLLCNPSSFYALPYICRNSLFQGKIYSSCNNVEMAHIWMQELFASIPVEYNPTNVPDSVFSGATCGTEVLPLFTSQQANDALTHVQGVHFGEAVPLSGGNIQCGYSGVSLGSCFWQFRTNRQTGLTTDEITLLEHNNQKYNQPSTQGDKLVIVSGGRSDPEGTRLPDLACSSRVCLLEDSLLLEDTSSTMQTASAVANLCIQKSNSNLVLAAVTMTNTFDLDVFSSIVSQGLLERRDMFIVQPCMKQWYALIPTLRDVLAEVNVVETTQTTVASVKPAFAPTSSILHALQAAPIENIGSVITKEQIVRGMKCEKPFYLDFVNLTSEKNSTHVSVYTSVDSCLSHIKQSGIVLIHPLCVAEFLAKSATACITVTPHLKNGQYQFMHYGDIPTRILGWKQRISASLYTHPIQQDTLLYTPTILSPLSMLLPQQVVIPKGYTRFLASQGAKEKQQALQTAISKIIDLFPDQCTFVSVDKANQIIQHTENIPKHILGAARVSVGLNLPYDVTILDTKNTSFSIPWNPQVLPVFNVPDTQITMKTSQECILPQSNMNSGTIVNLNNMHLKIVDCEPTYMNGVLVLHPLQTPLGYKRTPSVYGQLNSETLQQALLTDFTDQKAHHTDAVTTLISRTHKVAVTIQNGHVRIHTPSKEARRICIRALEQVGTCTTPQQENRTRLQEKPQPGEDCHIKHGCIDV